MTYIATLTNISLLCKEFSPNQPFTFTFLGFDGSVQYSAVIPPLTTCDSLSAGCPILFSTHGATVDASSPTWTGAYQPQTQAWVLLPTNRGAFGFDWQGPGRVDGLVALASFVANLPGVPPALRSVYAANPRSIFFAGHSMGGHGCLVFSTAYADRSVSFRVRFTFISLLLMGTSSQGHWRGLCCWLD
jgi:hypothetical protein